MEKCASGEKEISSHELERPVGLPGGDRGWSVG